MTYFELQETSFYKILQDLYILKEHSWVHSLEARDQALQRGSFEVTLTNWLPFALTQVASHATVSGLVNQCEPILAEEKVKGLKGKQILAILLEWAVDSCGCRMEALFPSWLL